MRFITSVFLLAQLLLSSQASPSDPITKPKKEFEIIDKIYKQMHGKWVGGGIFDLFRIDTWILNRYDYLPDDF